MQKNYGIPWGISEAAFNLKDLNNNYQYKAFGVPWLGLKRGLDDDIVVSPYSSFLSLAYDKNDSIKNIKRLEKEEMCGKYGFYESIDYTASRLNTKEKRRVVKTYMAHHQGLILTSINNCINSKILITRFYKNPEIEAIDILLQERMPEKAIVTKEKKEKVEKLKIKNYQNYSEKVFTKINPRIINSNVISNGIYTVCTLVDGQGFSKYKNILINRYKETSDYRQGNFFYIKDLENKKIISTNLEQDENGKIIFSPDITKFVKNVDNLIIKTSNIVVPDEPVEIKRLEINNIGEEVKRLEIINYFEPILSTANQDYSHPAFNNLFLTYERIDTDEILVKRKKRGKNETNLFLGASLYTEDEKIGNVEYEIDKEKFFGQGNIELPEMISMDKSFSNNLAQTTESILASKQKIKLEPQQKITIDLILCVSETRENVVESLKQYKNMKMITKMFELSKAKTEAEINYLGLKDKDIEVYQKMLSLLLFKNPLKSVYNKTIPNKVYMQSDLWKFGLSGDLPILLVSIRDISEKYVLKNILKAYEFFRSKNIKIELVILNKEINSYEHSLENEINGEIQNRQIMYLKNIFGGIFVINESEISKEDVDLLKFVSNLFIDASLGNIDLQLKDLEEEYSSVKISKNDINNYDKEEKIETLNEDYSSLKYYNEYGGFTSDDLEYKFKVSKDNKLPTIWSMVLANPNFGTIVTQNLGGFTWSKNSRLNRISAWNNMPSQDIPSEIIYLEDSKNGKSWSLSGNISDNQEYHFSYGFGYVNLKTIKDEIIQELTTFVPIEDNIKINLLKLKNTSNEKKNIKIFYYIKPVLGEDEIKTNGNIYVEKQDNCIVAKSLYNGETKAEEAFIIASEDIKEFTGNKEKFIGAYNLKRPQKFLDNDNGLYKESCIAVKYEIVLEPFENKEMVINLGAKNLNESIPKRYNNVEECKEELRKTKKYWYELLDQIHVNTPVESINIMLNGWAAYQTITSRLWAKSGYYQSRRSYRI